ncbi:beta-lactamase/transpeptidase-like protein [Xylaria cf. heliscus]|nr:beta-lactamase/transpeptidase-like protein [Xylaria cf. heliscus]
MGLGLLSVARILCPFLLLLPIEATLECRPPGPIVPRPKGVPRYAAFTHATDRLTQALGSALLGDIEAGWPVENTSFSIGLITRDQNDATVPAWEYHHLAPTNVNGTKELTRDSQYLIGSISKVISDYILLRSEVDLDESVTAYLPELADADSLISWEDITLRHLASHLAGIPPNYGFSEYYYLKEYFESLGFPHIGDDAYAPCGIFALNGGCTREQFMKGMLESYPVARPAERPVYSNIAFTLLMYAVEGRIGKNYTELLETYVSRPLGLTNTVVSPGDDDKAVIPPVDNSWGSDYGDNAPGGGLVSSLSDLSVFVRGILDRSIFDSDTAVHEWLKPASSTGSLNSLVGTPWEVFRTPHLTPDHPHAVDIYAKGGAAYGYQAQMAVIDEYGAGIVLLTAGSTLATVPIYDAILTTLIPALDEIAREQAVERGYAGTFVNSVTYSSNSSSLEGNEGTAFTVAIVQDKDSLVVQGIERNGTDILASLEEIWAVTLGGFVAFRPSKARIFPIDIQSEDSVSVVDGIEKRVIRQDWRVEWDFAPGNDTNLPGAGLSAGNCLTWTVTDWMYYGSEPIDRIVFVLDADSGDVVGLEIPYLRSGLLQPAKPLRGALVVR